MKSVSVFFILVATVSLGFVMSGRSAESKQETRPNHEDPIDVLMAERRDTLRRLVEIQTQRHKEGQTTYEKLIEAQILLLDADLDLAKDKAGRVRLHEMRVEKFRALEHAARQLYKTGTKSIDESLLATSARLEAEIELARQKQAPE